MTGVRGVRKRRSKSRAAAGDSTTWSFGIPWSFSASAGSVILMGEGREGAFVSCEASTPDQRVLRSSTSPRGRTRTSRSGEPLGQDVAVRRMSSRPWTVYPISPSIQTGASSSARSFSGVKMKLNSAARRFTSLTLKTWLEAFVHPAESPIACPQHRYRLSRFEPLTSVAAREGKNGLPQ